MKNFIIHSLSSWDFPKGSNIRDISYELSKNHNVIYLNIPIKYTELISNKLPWIKERKAVVKSGRAKIDVINKNLKVATTPVVFKPVNKLKPSKVFDYVNRANNKKFCKAIDDILTLENINDYYLINDNDIYSGFHFPDFLRPAKSIYYLRDFMTAMPYWSSNASRLEPELIRKYDMVMTNSLYLKKYAQGFNSNSHYVGQGCDVESLKKVPAGDFRPPELNKEGFEKIIGYVGELTSWRLDLDLIQHVAADNPNFLFVLVGNEDDTFRNSKLHDMDNVLFTGKRPFESLPDYLYSFDVCINPQGINEITVGNYPRKIDEYLTTGKPTVATHTETMLAFEDVTYLAKSKEEFSRMIKVAIEENSDEKSQSRRKVGESHNWTNSVGEMLKLLSTSP